MTINVVQHMETLLCFTEPIETLLCFTDSYAYKLNILKNIIQQIFQNWKKDFKHSKTSSQVELCF